MTVSRSAVGAAVSVTGRCHDLGRGARGDGFVVRGRKGDVRRPRSRRQTGLTSDDASVPRDRAQRAARRGPGAPSSRFRAVGRHPAHRAVRRARKPCVGDASPTRWRAIPQALPVETPRVEFARPGERGGAPGARPGARSCPSTQGSRRSERRGARLRPGELGLSPDRGPRRRSAVVVPLANEWDGGRRQLVTLKVANAWSSAAQSASDRICTASTAVYEASSGTATSTTISVDPPQPDQ
jgi:hypothetical protein